MAENCDLCGLYKKCNGPVSSSGPTTAKIVVVAESPGPSEDIEGKVLIGDTGRLFNYMIRMVGLRREELFLTNAVKCFPNKTKLTVKHPQYCKPQLVEELSLLKNKEIIVAFGNTATQALLGRSNISETNGYFWDYDGTPVLSLIHPAAVLRNLFQLENQIRHLRKVFWVVK